MARRRRGGADGLTTIYWRDIPAQLTATVAGTAAKIMLEPRFQHAIDRAAAVAELTETEAYIAQWRRATEPVTATAETEGEAWLDAMIEARARDLTERYPRERLEELVARGGADAAGDTPTSPNQTTRPDTPNEESDR